MRHHVSGVWASTGLHRGILSSSETSTSAPSPKVLDPDGESLAVWHNRWLEGTLRNGYVRSTMVTDYRKANEIADLLDFYEGIIDTPEDRSAVTRLRSELAEQERIDGRPADPVEERQGFTGAI